MSEKKKSVITVARVTLGTQSLSRPNGGVRVRSDLKAGRPGRVK